MFAIFRYTRLRLSPTACLIALTSSIAIQPAPAQTTAPNQWTWVGGSSTPNPPAVYGTLGVLAAANTPGGRRDPASWTDSARNVWLYGGDDVASHIYEDLWEYNPAANQWAWMGGSTSTNQFASYGTMGLPAASNSPGSRSGPATWVDKSGNVWLFGGSTYGGHINFLGNTTIFWDFPDDLWLFNTSTRQWTWMGGSNTVPCNACGQPPVYGQMGTPAAGNTPGSRGGQAIWTDPDGDIWFFAGTRFPTANREDAGNDLWKFNPSTNLWAWMGGSDEGNQPGVYGTLGTPAPGNLPGGRTVGLYWTDKSGNIWISGGSGYDAAGTFGNLTDLWEFNPSSQQWAWMGGSKTATPEFGNAPVDYGILGVPSAANGPGGGGGDWTDTTANQWFLGNALWEFDPSTQEWTWMGGNSWGNQDISYGVQGVPAPANFPGYRDGETAWTDSAGNFWLFGGALLLESGSLDDIWEYQPSSTPLLPSHRYARPLALRRSLFRRSNSLHLRRNPRHRLLLHHRWLRSHIRLHAIRRPLPHPGK